MTNQKKCCIIKKGDNMIEILTEEEFNAFAQNNDNSIFFQSSYWGKLKEKTGWIYYLVGLKEDDEIKGVSLLLAKKIPVIGKYIFYSPRGYLIDYNDLELLKKYSDGIIKFVKEHDGIFIKINPLMIYQERNIDGDVVENGINNKKLFDFLIKEGYKHNGFNKEYGKDLEPRWISVLNLENKTEESLLKEMRSTTRWSVKNSYKNSLIVKEASLSDLKHFKELMKHTSERRGFIDRPLSYYEAMYKSFIQTDNIKVLLVDFDATKQIERYQNQIDEIHDKLQKIKKDSQRKELESQINSISKKIVHTEELKQEYGNNVTVAGGLYMLFGNQIVYLFGASLKPFMHLNSQYLLQWEMIKYGLQNHYKKFNFYGIDPAFNELSPMFGLFDFKRGFGAHVEELIGEFTYVTNPFYNKIYNMMFKFYRILKKVKK